MQSLLQLPLVMALSLSVGLHTFLLMPWQPRQQTMEAPGGQSLALNLGQQQQAIDTVTEVPPEALDVEDFISELIHSDAIETAWQVNEYEWDEVEQMMTQQSQDEWLADAESIAITREARFRSQPVPPVYPEQARRARQQGVVIVRARVNALGETEIVQVAESSGFQLLDEAALDAVMLWEFMPAEKNQQTMSAWIEVPVDFTLQS